MDDKYLVVTMPNKRQYLVPARVVAENKAEYMSKKHGTKYEDEYFEAIGDDSEIVDWAANNMNWKDIAHTAHPIPEIPLTDEQLEDGWCNGIGGIEKVNVLLEPLDKLIKIGKKHAYSYKGRF
jgi:hypothetical protein